MEARQAINKAGIYASDNSDKQQVNSLRQQLDAEGQRQLGLCKQAYVEKDYLEAITGYGKIIRFFGGLPSGNAAKKLLSEAEKVPEIKLLLQEIEAKELDDVIAGIIGNKKDDDAANPPALNDGQKTPENIEQTQTRVEQVKSLPVEKQARVVDLLGKIEKLYPDTQTGQLATEDLKSLQADEKFRDTLKRHLIEMQAKGLFNNAENYRKANLYAKALMYYEQVVQKFPDSEYAEKARVMANKMKVMKAATPG